MVLDNRQVVTLAYRGAIPMQLAAGARIECTRGRIWVTEDGRPGDIVLEPGQCHEIDRGGATLVQALREATFSVRSPVVLAAAARLPARLAQLFGTLRAKPAAAPTPA